MPIPNKSWLQRTRRCMCANYQALCQISNVDYERKGRDADNAYTRLQRSELDKAISAISKSIDHLNTILELPEGS